MATKTPARAGAPAETGYSAGTPLNPPSPLLTTPTSDRSHRAGLRGLTNYVASSSTREGRFGRLFRNLPVLSHSEEALNTLASAMVTKAEEDLQLGGADPEETETNRGEHMIPAGYTYLGQFIDHDLTFDPASSLERQNDPDALVNFRTPAFDLDNVYGRGPSDQPYLYDQSEGSKGLLFLLGDEMKAGPSTSYDLPRNTQGRALIGDPRNDENGIVSQLQGVMLRFHNRMVEHVRIERGLTGDDLFKEAQRLVRWHYQWVVVHDFLPRMVGNEMMAAVLPETPIAAYGQNGASAGASYARPNLRFYHPDHAFMPVEFAVAAYRFGHSMIRPIYSINGDFDNATKKRKTIFGENPETKEKGPSGNLTGFGRPTMNHGIEWKYFFEMGATSAGDLPQPAYRIDQQLVNALGDLPDPIAIANKSLARRNLIRGLRMGLPSGQTVARKMGFAPIRDADLLVGPHPDKVDKRPSITEMGSEFRDNAPLWYYILREAEYYHQGMQLGPVGGTIVAETFVGLLYEDRLSYLRVEPTWKPDPYVVTSGRKFKSGTGSFGMPELIRFALADE